MKMVAEQLGNGNNGAGLTSEKWSSSHDGGRHSWLACKGSDGEMGSAFEPLLSNLQNALRGDLNVMHVERNFQISLWNKQNHIRLIRCRRKDKNNSTRKRRVMAAISLSGSTGIESKEIESVSNAVGSPFEHSKTTSKEISKGWFGEVVRARAFYKNISVVDRAKIGAIAGGLAGGFTYCCLHPIDTVRTKLQTRETAKLYKNGFDVVVSILKTRGPLGFYSGISAVLVGSMLSSAVYFGCIELGRTALVKYTSCSAFLIPPLSGAFGNIVSSSILVPKEVIAQRMQAGASGRSWDLAVRTIQKEGVRGLYAGYAAALLRNLPSSVLSFTTFEYVKAVWLRSSEKKSLKPWQSVVSGALAGAISGALTTPLDVVKTRLMTQAKKEVMGTVASDTMTAELRAKIAVSSYKGILSTMKRIWTEEGWIGLTKGMGPRLLHSALFSALGYFAFETVRVELVRRHMARVQTSETNSDDGIPIIL